MTMDMMMDAKRAVGVLFVDTSSPLMPTLLVFSFLLAVAVARTLPALISFYASFCSSGFELAAHRGYGQSACKFYDIFPAPKLSVPAMAVSGFAFLGLVVFPSMTACAAWMRAPCLGAAILFYHLYFSQLYCEAHVGAHVTVLIPPALLLLAMSPAIDADSVDGPLDDRSTLAAAAFTCWMMKIVLTSAYCGAGVCKITHSIKSLHNGFGSWCTGSTLQAFIFEAMFLSNPSTHTSFGMPTPWSYALQKLHLLNPRLLLMPASFGAVAFETLAPLVLLAPPYLASIPFAFSGLAFHYGIALLQNIDFLSWWGPAYAFFLADPAAWAGGGLFAPPSDLAPLGLLESVRLTYEAAPIRATVSMAYVAMHVLAVVVLRFFPSVEVLPLSSFPMFGAPHNLFDRRLRKHFWLTDKAHATGTLKNYAFPFCRPQTIRPHEIERLPFKYLLLSHGGCGAGPKSSAMEPVLHTNVQMTARLATALKQMTSLCKQEPDTFACCSNATPLLLASLEEAKAAFAEAPRVMPSAHAQKTLRADHASCNTSEPTCVIDATPSTASVMADERSAGAFPEHKPPLVPSPPPSPPEQYGASVGVGSHKPTKQD